MKSQRDLRDPARPGCSEDWNGREWPKERPEWPATEKTPMIGRCYRVRPIRKAHAYPVLLRPRGGGRG
jgi:hypothetical protein